ncbi:MAG: hypothetical protein SNJ64_05970 [Endomicrobiia bacterium]
MRPFGRKMHGKCRWGDGGKIIVFGILKRNGKIRVFPITERKNEFVQKLIQHHTKPCSLYYIIILYTDD